MLLFRAMMMPLCKTALLFVVIVVLCPHALLAEQIPLIKRGGVYQLSAEINGVITLRFVLDTGAADVNILADVALTLYRAGTIRDADFLPGRTYTLADGSTLNSSRFLLRSLKIGSHRVTNVPASIGTLSSALLLGQSFLERLGPWGLDSQRQVLTIGTKGQRKQPTPNQTPLSPRGGPQVAGGSSPPQPETSPTTMRGNDGAEMVLVPAGEFIMGSNADEIDHLLRDWPDAKREFFKDEMPRHQVYLDAFSIDKYEVTNTRFQQFVQATGYRTQAERAGWTYVWHAPQGLGSTIAGLEQHPVVYVSQEDAKAYYAWAGKRLPTEAEWEKAARGTDGRIYPWGNQFDEKRMRFCDVNCLLPSKRRGTVPVGSYKGGKSPYGTYDMAGNVAEWVADWFDATYYQHSPARNSRGPMSGEIALPRGGGWNNLALGVRAPTRFRDAQADRDGDVGFRCAKTL